MSSSSMESSNRLQNLLLREAKVDPAIVAFMTGDTLKLASVSDFANFFTRDDFSQGVQDDILNKLPDFKEDKLQRGRLRTAWELATAEFQAFTSKRATGTSFDEDLPLDPDDKKAQEDSFHAFYHIKLEPAVSP
eukprot:6477432-Amphidinium_carterae.1